MAVSLSRTRGSYDERLPDSPAPVCIQPSRCVKLKLGCRIWTSETARAVEKKGGGGGGSCLVIMCCLLSLLRHSKYKACPRHLPPSREPLTLCRSFDLVHHLHLLADMHVESVLPWSDRPASRCKYAASKTSVLE